MHTLLTGKYRVVAVYMGVLVGISTAVPTPSPVPLGGSMACGASMPCGAGTSNGCLLFGPEDLIVINNELATGEQ